MSDSIEKDEEFMKLVKTSEKLEREIAAVFSYEMLLCEYDNGKRLHNLQLEAFRARKEIYRYIDRRVERAILEERNKEPILKLKEYPPEAIRYYARPLSDNRAEMMRVNSDGLCYIHKDYCADERVLKNLKKALVEQIIKIDPALLMIKDHSLGFEGLFIESVLELEERTIVVFFRFDGMRLELRFKSNNGLIEISLPKIAKYFSDEVNKIARDKYAPK